MPIQLRLAFPQPVTTAMVHTNWSYSRSLLFASCPRAFYFELRRQTFDEVGERIATRDLSLKALVGLAVHRSIELEIEKWASHGSIDVQRAQDHAESFLSEIWSDAPHTVIEIANGMEVEPDTPRRLVHRSKRLLRDFFRLSWPHFSALDYRAHEKGSRFTVGGREISVRIDFCGQDSARRLVIADWKTGSVPAIGPGALQLGIYGLWAHHALKYRVGQIRTALVNLSTSEIVRHDLTSGDLARAKAVAFSELRTWEGLSQVEDFPAIAERGKCISCPFLRRCSEGRQAVDASSGIDSSGMARMTSDE